MSKKSPLSSFIDGGYLRLRNWKNLFFLIIFIFFLVLIKVEFGKWSSVCKGDDCVEIIFTSPVNEDFIEGVDKKKYDWIKLYRGDSDKLAYKRYFEYDNTAVFFVEKGQYEIETNQGRRTEGFLFNEERQINLP